MSLRQFSASKAARYTTKQLVLRLLLSLGIMAIGGWFSIHPDSAGQVVPPSIAWLCTVMMGICALSWGYTLALKLTNQASGPTAPSGCG